MLIVKESRDAQDMYCISLEIDLATSDLGARSFVFKFYLRLFIWKIDFV